MPRSDRDPKLPKGMYFKKTHKCYFLKRRNPATGKREDIRLGKELKAASEKYHLILAGQLDTSAGLENSVKAILAAFHDWSEANHSEKTHTHFFHFYLESFEDSIDPGLKVEKLTPYHITRWIDRRFPKKKGPDDAKGCSDNTRHNAVRAIKRVFNWAVKQKLLKESPVKHTERPPQRPRDVYYEEGQYEKILRAIPDQEYLDVCRFLRHTGCRPEEMRIAEARFFDRQNACLVIPWNLVKTRETASAEDRVIRLSPAALEIVQRLALKNPEGPIFRNTDGKPWTKDAMNCRNRRLAKRLGFRVTAYTFRHTFITDCLVAGLDIQTVAKLVGHKDLRMIAKVYEHLQKRGEFLQKKLEEGTRGVA